MEEYGRYTGPHPDPTLPTVLAAEADLRPSTRHRSALCSYTICELSAGYHTAPLLTELARAPVVVCAGYGSIQWLTERGMSGFVATSREDLVCK